MKNLRTIITSCFLLLTIFSFANNDSKALTFSEHNESFVETTIPENNEEDAICFSTSFELVDSGKKTKKGKTRYKLVVKTKIFICPQK